MASEDKTVLIAEATPPSSLTTDESRRAWFATETRIANLSIKMFNFILESRPTAVELASHFSSEDIADIQETMWRLVDTLFVEIGPDNRLSVIGSENTSKNPK